MRRRWVALVVALAFAVPLAAPLAASAPAGCARCAGAARCCCAPERGPGGCGLARPCGPASGGEGVAAPQEQDKALPEAPVRARASAARSTSTPAFSRLEPAGSPFVPPDPPPKSSL